MQNLIKIGLLLEALLYKCYFVSILTSLQNKFRLRNFALVMIPGMIRPFQNLAHEFVIALPVEFKVNYTFSKMKFEQAIVILSFGHFINNLGLCSVTSLAFVRFNSNFDYTLTIRQCTCVRKIGAEGSVLKVLCLFVIL